MLQATNVLYLYYCIYVRVCGGFWIHSGNIRLMFSIEKFFFFFEKARVAGNRNSLKGYNFELRILMDNKILMNT